MNPHLPNAKPELLAPAGDWEALRAAVANGADVVYFGLSAFNARARAANFTVDELPEVMAFLHDRNVRGYVALNVLIFSDELDDAERFIRACAGAGVDAVIVQDLGLVRLIRAIAPTLPIHASTQMTLSEARGLEFVRELGASRAVLARELSVADVSKIAVGSPLPLEVFVHGALCVAYSGQCLTSEALGGRSANRGQCAQACRMPYELYVDGEYRDLGDKAYLLSPQDLAAYDLISPLLDAGVSAFKIEGRLKGGPYVAAATAMYRKAIDAAVAGREAKFGSKEKLDLAQTFSRGLTHGFLDGVDHQKLVRGRFPKSRGNLIGTVLNVRRDGATLRPEPGLIDYIREGDGVLFDLAKPEEKEPGGRVTRVQRRGDRLELEFAPGSIDLSRVSSGTPVWKTDDPELKKVLSLTYSQDKPARRVRIAAALTGRLGGELSLTYSDAEGRNATAAWPGPLEAARQKPTSPDDIRVSLARLGETPFELADLALGLPANAMVPKSVLNDLRRQASERLKALRQRVHPLASSNAVDEIRPTPVAPAESGVATLTILVRNLDQLAAVLPLKPDGVVCDFEDLRRYAEAVPLAKAAGVPVALATNRIWKPGEDGFQSLVVRAKPDAVLVRNLASIRFFREQLPKAELHGDFSLNAANELAAEVYFEAGLTKLVPSFDLNWPQLAAMLKRSDPGRFEPVVHQHMPMFHMEHCVFAAFLSTGKDHRDCGRPCEEHRIELRDRVGASFPVHPDTGCRNTVFNSLPQSAAEYIGRMKSLGVRHFRIDLLRETPEEIAPLVEHYRRVIDGSDGGQSTWRQLKALNQLGVTRGTLQLA